LRRFLETKKEKLNKNKYIYIIMKYLRPELKVFPFHTGAVICVSPVGPSNGVTDDFDIDNTYNELA